MAAVVILVADAERVADLVRRELADAGDRGLRQDGRRLGAVLVRREQAFEDQVVLPVAQRAERDGRLDDLAGARIRERRARAPAARRAVDPVDHVVADVHRVGALGQQLHLKRVAIAGGLERLVPPARPFEQRRSDRLGRAAVDVVLDRFLRVAHARGRVDLLEPVPPGEALDERRRDRRGVVGVLQRAETRARVVEPRLVVAVGQLGEGVVLAQRDGIRRRRDAADRCPRTCRRQTRRRRAPTAAAPAAGRAAAVVGRTSASCRSRCSSGTPSSAAD